MNDNYMKTILSGVKEWTENLTDDAIDKANNALDKANNALDKANNALDKALFVVNITTTDGETFSADKTFDEIVQVYNEGKYNIVAKVMGVYIIPLLAIGDYAIMFGTTLIEAGNIVSGIVAIAPDNSIQMIPTPLATTKSKLPNPYPLTFTGAVSETYDGSSAKTIEIPIGLDGITPTIGDNGNWYLGSTDTGKPSRGEKGDTGEKGEKGETGADGKSAYSYAVDGGYTGTKAEFAAKLAAEKLPNPYPLTFTGAVSGSYDGSAPLSVEIPSGGSGGEGATSNYVELGTLPYTVGNITELYLEPSEDCSLVIGSGNDNNLITSLKDSLISSNNPVIDNLLSEEYSGTHTVKLIATNTNGGNSFYDLFDVTGLTVGTEYTFSCTVGLSGISGSAYGRVALGAGTQLGTYGGVYGQADGERISLTFTASNTTVRIQLFIWTGYAVAVGDAITYSDCLLCEGTSTEFGTSVTYELSAGNKTKLSFAEGTEIPAVDGVTITVYKLVEGVAGDLFVFLGDSIPCFDSNTGGIGAIPDYLREKCGGTWKNFCVGGTTMSAYRTTGNGYEYFTLDEWADSIATGNFANQEQGVTDGASAGSTSYSLTKKVSDAQALDWSAVKCVFFAFGTNDLAYGVSEVGASTDAATKHGTMCAALKYAVQTIQATYPVIKIVVCGIIYRHADNPSVSAIIAANDAIRSTCESIGVPFVPLFENMGVNEWNQTAFLYDGTHPNAAGKERYADTVKRLLCL